MNRKDRRAAGKRGLDAPVTDAASLFAQAVHHHQAGRLPDAERLFRHVLAIERGHIASLHHLGMIALQRGEPQAAIEPISRALAIDPGNPVLHYNFAHALAAQGRADEAIGHLRTAVTLAPNFSEAHVRLGAMLQAQGRLDEAAQCFERSLSLKPTPEAMNDLGVVLAVRGDHVAAVRRFEQALAHKPDFIDACNNIACSFMAMGRMDAALGALRRALAIRETPASRKLFVQCAQLVPAPPDGDDFRALVLRALLEPWGRPSDLASTALGLLKQTGAVRDCMARVAAAWPRRLSAGELFGPAGLSAVAQDRLLRCVLETAPIADVDFERFLTSARSAMLDMAANADGSSPADAVGFLCALARQCFFNAYVFAPTDEEAAAAERLRDEVAARLAANAAIPELRIAAVASYFPLGSLPQARSMLDANWSAALAGVLTQQLREPAEEAALRAAIPALTPVDDGVSHAVRQQYEESPYPSWERTAPPVRPLSFDQYLRGKFPGAVFRAPGKGEIDMLIAGCGTGQHSIESAARLPGARVLAIDLSRASLAYAMRKTRELGLRNIEYAQADILRLGAVDRMFDVIESSGVLHHLADPFAGWRVLLSRLRPGGFMAVGLYSEIGRADVVAARQFIAERGFRPTADGIRRCRQELIAREGGRSLKSAPDFFTLNGCRDLLFNVQEHRLTLPQVAAFLAANELQFIGFDVDAQVAARYRGRYPADTAMTDLNSWDAFEREFPNTFAAMYVFWVQKRA